MPQLHGLSDAVQVVLCDITHIALVPSRVQCKRKHTRVTRVAQRNLTRHRFSKDPCLHCWALRISSNVLLDPGELLTIFQDCDEAHNRTHGRELSLARDQFDLPGVQYV